MTSSTLAPMTLMQVFGSPRRTTISRGHHTLLKTLLLAAIVYATSFGNIVAGADSSCTNDGEGGKETCTANDDSDEGSNNSPPEPRRAQFLSATFQNLSKYRADIHYDDGRFGSFVATMEANGGEGVLQTFPGHSFFITMHGVRESLVDPATDEQYFFRVPVDKQEGPHFILPAEAKPSTTKCKDRYPICVNEAE